MTQHTYVIDKSTVPVGTADKVRLTIQKELDSRKSDLTFDVQDFSDALLRIPLNERILRIFDYEIRKKR